tara:strand:+ start:139936 stop:140553 length:618 start_codon:yes stop_codon:yes gene_type:complete
MQLEIGKAKFEVSIRDEDMGGEFPGECCWMLDAKSMCLILERFPELDNSFSIPDGIQEAIENWTEENEETECYTLADLPDDWQISFRDADSGIVLVCAMIEIGGEWSLSWEGEGEMWFFHDWDHAVNDAHDNGNGGIDVAIDGDREERAYVAGARGAIRNGADIGDICNALAAVVKPFHERFGYEPSRMWGGIFEGFKLAEAVTV